LVHRRKAATWRAKVRRLTLIHACRDPLHTAVVGVVAQVELEDLHRLLVLNHPSAGRHQRLRHAAARKDLLPDTLGELVAAIGGPPTEPGEGLEEQAPSVAPQTLCVSRLDHLGVRNSSQQNVLRGPWHPQALKPCCVTQQGQIALVRIQRMRLRVWREHDGIGKVGLAQRCAGGFSEREIGQAVVDQVDGDIPQPEHAVTQTELSGASDDRLQPVPLEQARTR